MAKKIQILSVNDIVLSADTETIKQALEKRAEIDRLLNERRELYQRIAELETQVEAILGETSQFPFPEPPMPVAISTGAKSKTSSRSKAAVKPLNKPEETSNNEVEATKIITDKIENDLTDKIKDDLTDKIEDDLSVITDGTPSNALSV